MSNIDWAATWAGATTVVSFGLLVATGVYAWLTWRLVKASEAQSWEMARPRILVSLQTTQGGQYMNLQIENVGALPAQDVRLELNRKVFRHIGNKDEINDIPIFRDGLSAFPPRTRIRIGFGMAYSYLAPEVDRERHPLSFAVKTTYKSGRRAIEEHHPIEIERQLSRTAVDKDYVQEFARTFPDVFEKKLRELVRAIEDHGRTEEPDFIGTDNTE